MTLQGICKLTAILDRLGLASFCPRPGATSPPAGRSSFPLPGVRESQVGSKNTSGCGVHSRSLEGEAVPEQAGTGSGRRGGIRRCRSAAPVPHGLTAWPHGQTGRECAGVLEGQQQGGSNCAQGDPHSMPRR